MKSFSLSLHFVPKKKDQNPRGTKQNNKSGYCNPVNNSSSLKCPLQNIFTGLFSLVKNYIFIKK